MSDYGEEIIDRLGEDCGLRKPGNHVRDLINDGVGEWFDRFVAENDFDNLFLDTATGGYLDLWGKDYGVPRKLDEDDESYRNRIIYEVLGYLTIPYLLNVYGLTLYTYSEDFDPTDNTLVSDNPYVNVSGGFMTVADSDVQASLTRKFVLGTDLTFIDLDGDS